MQYVWLSQSAGTVSRSRPSEARNAGKSGQERTQRRPLSFATCRNICPHRLVGKGGEGDSSGGSLAGRRRPAYARPAVEIQCGPVAREADGGQGLGRLGFSSRLTLPGFDLESADGAQRGRTVHQRLERATGAGEIGRLPAG